MPSRGGTRTYSVIRQQQRELLPDPPQSSSETTLGGGGERQVNSPAPIGVGVGRSPLSERLVRRQQGIGGSGMELKRGNLVPAPQLDNSCQAT